MNQTITLPGLIDPHVHLRDPGQTHKEDFNSGTSAALAGGYTMVLDMPNNLDPITTIEKLENKINILKAKALADVGLIFGTLGDNLDQFEKVQDKVSALKIYLNVTTGNFIIDKDKLLDIYKAWPSDKPIMLHAEDDVSELVMSVLKKVPKRTHMCHVSSRAELQFVIDAKNAGLPVTCGVTPHHFFLTDNDKDVLGSFGHMKPYLKPQADKNFLWDNLDAIDIFESDHAPHTFEEKTGQNPPFGVPGLETTLPLLLSESLQGNLDLDYVKQRTHDNPKTIFNLPDQPNTSVIFETGEFTINNESLYTKAGWSPFNGRKVNAKINEVILRGNVVFKNNKILTALGSGQFIVGG